MISFASYFRSAPLILLEDTTIGEGLQYHLEHNIPLYDSVYRIYSDAYFALLAEARDLYFRNILKVTDEDAELLESNLGEVGLYKGKTVYLDAPFILEKAETKSKKQGKHRLGAPFRTPGGPKKFAVYVRTPGGSVKKVTFGDPNMRVRNNNAARAKSFRARHKCSEKKDRTTAGYWSCHVSRYKKALGLKSGRVW